jgi:hypothetical protein
MGKSKPHNESLNVPFQLKNGTNGKPSEITPRDFYESIIGEKVQYSILKYIFDQDVFFGCLEPAQPACFQEGDAMRCSDLNNRHLPSQQVLYDQ